MNCRRCTYLGAYDKTILTAFYQLLKISVSFYFHHHIKFLPILAFFYNTKVMTIIRPCKDYIIFLPILALIYYGL